MNKKVIVTVLVRSGDNLEYHKEMYLCETEVVRFSDDITDAIIYDTRGKAIDAITDRFISLAYWIYKRSGMGLFGIYICELDENDNISRRDRYL